jgi:hypothetical protein
MRLKPGQQRPKKHRGPKLRYTIWHPDLLIEKSGDGWTSSRNFTRVRNVRAAASFVRRLLQENHPGQFEVERAFLTGPKQGLAQVWAWGPLI